MKQRFDKDENQINLCSLKLGKKFNKMTHRIVHQSNDFR